MEVAVLKYSGEKTAKKVTLSDEVFGIEPNDHAIYLDVCGMVTMGSVR